MYINLIVLISIIPDYQKTPKSHLKTIYNCHCLHFLNFQKGRAMPSRHPDESSSRYLVPNPQHQHQQQVPNPQHQYQQVQKRLRPQSHA